MWTKPQLIQRMKGNERALRPRPGLTLIYYLEVWGRGTAPRGPQSPEALERARGHCSSWALQVAVAAGRGAGEGQASALRPPSKPRHQGGTLQTQSAKDRGPIALCTVLIRTTCARETQHMRGLVIGGTLRKAGTVSQRLCFRRDWSPQNSKDFWWREG